jgi:hypothetical protein
VAPRQFWCTPSVKMPEDIGTVRLWWVFGTAKATGSGDYTLEVLVRDNEGRLRRSADFTIWRNEGAYYGRQWTVGAHTLSDANALGFPITRRDGNDFRSMKQAVWMCMEKTIESALADIARAHNTRAWAEARDADGPYVPMAWGIGGDRTLMSESEGKFAPQYELYLVKG